MTCIKGSLAARGTLAASVDATARHLTLERHAWRSLEDPRPADGGVAPGSLWVAPEGELTGSARLGVERHATAGLAPPTLAVGPVSTLLTEPVERRALALLTGQSAHAQSLQVAALAEVAVWLARRAAVLPHAARPSHALVSFTGPTLGNEQLARSSSIHGDAPQAGRTPEPPLRRVCAWLAQGRQMEWLRHHARHAGATPVRTHDLAAEAWGADPTRSALSGSPPEDRSADLGRRDPTLVAGCFRPLNGACAPSLRVKAHHAGVEQTAPSSRAIKERRRAANLARPDPAALVALAPRARERFTVLRHWIDGASRHHQHHHQHRAPHLRTVPQTPW